MMLRKAMATAMAGATLLTMAGPAFGTFRYPIYRGGHDQGGEVSIENKDIDVYVKADASSDTGDNYQGASAGGSQGYSLWGWHKGGSDVKQKMTTGAAGSDAWVGIVDVASTDIEADCGCLRKSDVKVENRDLDVTVKAEAESETGENEQYVGGGRRHRGGSSGDVSQRMTTGRADSSAGVGDVYVAYTTFMVGE